MEKAVVYYPLSKKVTAPSAVIVTPARPIAYYIKDPNFDDFPIYESSNAWWMEKGKVEKLIEAFKMGHLVETACFYAAISKDKWRYFNEVHPNFSPLIQEIKRQPVYIKAMNSVVGAIDTDPHLAMTMLKATHSDFTGKKVEENLVQPQVAVQINNTINTNETEMEKRARARSIERVSEESGAVQEGGIQAVAA